MRKHFVTVVLLTLVFLIVQEWLKRYSQRRYGKAVHKIEAAWEILHGTIYNCTDGIAVCFLSNKSIGCSISLLLISLMLSEGYRDFFDILNQFVQFDLFQFYDA